MKVYIVNWKETTLNENGETSVESGVCDYGYTDERKAAEQIEALAREKADECIDEYGYDEDDVSVSGEGDCRCIEAGSNKYEYFITTVIVD